MNPVHRRYRRIMAGAVGAAAALLTFGAAATAAAAQPATPAATILGEGAPGAIRDSYIVVVRGSTAEARRMTSAAGELAQRYGGSVRRTYSSAVPGFAATMTAASARRLAADPSVAYVEQDRMVSRQRQLLADHRRDRLGDQERGQAGGGQYEPGRQRLDRAG